MRYNSTTIMFQARSSGLLTRVGLSRAIARTEKNASVEKERSTDRDI